MESLNLKPREYYSDLYDEVTVESCRRIEKRSKDVVRRNGKGELSPEESMMLTVDELMMYLETGERYLKKEEVVKEWMERDRARDDQLENSSTPNDIYCNDCGDKMHSESKSLFSRDYNDKEKVLYIFRCPSGCKQGRAIFEDGEEWKTKKDLCDKCGVDLDRKNERSEEEIVTTFSCPDCGFTKTEKLNLSKEEDKEPDKFFNRDRARFCLNEKKGSEYSVAKLNIESLSKTMDKLKEKENNKELYDRVAKIKKLTIVELENLLIKNIEKAGYVKFTLGEPEMDRDVKVSFTARDSKTGRENWDSKNELKKIINNSLIDTNWRLMSDGTNYRLGILTGRLRAYEKEEDLIKLFKK